MTVLIEFAGEQFRPYRVQRYRVKALTGMNCAVDGCGTYMGLKVVRQSDLRQFVPDDMPIADDELEARCRVHRDVAGDFVPPDPDGKRVEEK